MDMGSRAATSVQAVKKHSCADADVIPTDPGKCSVDAKGDPRTHGGEMLAQTQASSECQTYQ